MYRFGRKKKHKLRKYTRLGIALVVIAGVGAIGIFLYDILSESDEATIKTSQTITREFAPPPTEEKLFNQGLFELKLPPDWELKEHVTDQFNRYTWQAAKKNADNRWLEIYVDSLPLSTAVNRIVPVSIANNGITIAAPISENCTTFTGTQGPNEAPDKAVPVITTKWENVVFDCDMANYIRNLVGVGVEGNEKGITLTSPTSGPHKFFIIYTDHNYRPDYQILERALTSFTLK